MDEVDLSPACISFPQDLDSWLSNRESVQNFDKATFLSDQPLQHFPFMSRFLETQMFTSLIDSKILKSYNQQDDLNIALFDTRIHALRYLCLSFLVERVCAM